MTAPAPPVAPPPPRAAAVAEPAFGRREPAAARPDGGDLLARAEAVAAFCARRAAESDDAGTFPDAEVARLAEAGLLLLPLPRPQGGIGPGAAPGATAVLLRVSKAIGRGSLPVGRLYEGHVNALQLIARFGRPEQVDRAAADARRGLLFAVWNTEAPGDGGVRLRPLPSGRHRVEGAKTFASGAGRVARPLVTGRLLPGGGWQMFVPPLFRHDAVIDRASWRPLGMGPSASYRIDLTGVELDGEDLIGLPGDYHRQPWFYGGAIRFAAVQLGGAEALLDVTRRHLRRAGRADDPYQRARVGSMAIAVEAGDLWLDRAASVTDACDGGDGAATERAVAHAHMVRTAVERICLDTLEAAQRAIGLAGLQRPHPLERISRDLTMYLRQAGPDAALAEVGRFVLASGAPAARLWRDGDG